MGDERREANRYNVWFMMKLEKPSGDGEVAAVSHNASEKGMLFATGAKLEVGSPVKVKLRVHPDAEERVIEAKIIRVQKNENDTLGLWPHLVAVEIVPPMEDLDVVLSEAAARTAPQPPAAPKADDRRDGTRHSVWFPLKVDTPQASDGVAVSRNISETGVLMLSASKLDPGSTVTVTFRVERSEPDRTVEAKIVRMERNTGDTTGIWPWRVAVEFVEPIAELAPMLREAAKKEG
jgi:hypothetical protein